MVLRFYFIPNMEKFAALVAASCGKVLLRKDDAFCSLKGDDRALAFIKGETAKGRRIEIHVADTRDYFAFVNFMVGACL